MFQAGPVTGVRAAPASPVSPQPQSVAWIGGIWSVPTAFCHKDREMVSREETRRDP